MDELRVLHDALRILGRREGGWLPSPTEGWSPGEWTVVLAALVDVAGATETVHQFTAEAIQRRENLHRKAMAGAKLSARSFQVWRRLGGQRMMFG